MYISETSNTYKTLDGMSITITLKKVQYVSTTCGRNIHTCDFTHLS